VAKQVLGKGLQALIPDSRLEELEREARYIPIAQISSFPGQPRKFFKQDKLENLAKSISQHGIIQPVLVTKSKGGEYQLIAGERRLKAAKEAGLLEIPAVITSIAEDKRLELSLIENIQRENLNPIEEALAYKSMLDDLGLTQEEIAQRISKERSTVTNSLRLLKLPAEIKQDLIDQKISMGHARAVLALNNTGQQLKACRYVTQKGLSVRETEKYVQKCLHPAPQKNLPQPDVQIADLENKLKKSMATKVKISLNKAYKGKISIEFYSAEDLERITNMLLYSEEGIK
jgi:ParB family chromosome partitioning protein